MKQALYVLILSLLASCALVPDEWYDDSPNAREISGPVRSYSILPPPPETVFDGSETVYRTNYTLNETLVAKVGEPVLRIQAFKKDNFVTHQLILEKPVKVTIEKEEMLLPAKRYPVFGTFEWGAETFYVLPKYKQYYFLVNMKGELQPMYLYEIKNSDKVTIFNDKAKFSPSSARMKMYSFSNQDKIPFTDFEVVYDGVKNNQIVLFYKNAVPGTDGNTGSFDTRGYPADSTMISVEGRLLRVLRADRDQMTYVVIKD